MLLQVRTQNTNDNISLRLSSFAPLRKTKKNPANKLTGLLC